MKRLVLTLLCCFIAIPAAGETPLGYPWSTWGELSYTFHGKDERGLKLDGYFEQGVDWLKVGDSPLVVNTFAGLRGTVSGDAQDYWNNKWGPWLGLKVKCPLPMTRGWGELDLGVRWEYYNYIGSYSPYSYDSRGVVFLQWSLGGNWKK